MWKKSSSKHHAEKLSKDSASNAPKATVWLLDTETHAVNGCNPATAVGSQHPSTGHLFAVYFLLYQVSPRHRERLESNPYVHNSRAVCFTRLCFISICLQRPKARATPSESADWAFSPRLLFVYKLICQKRRMNLDFTISVIIWGNICSQNEPCGLFLGKHSRSSPQRHVILSHSRERVLISCWTKITLLFALCGAYRFFIWKKMLLYKERYLTMIGEIEPWYLFMLEAIPEDRKFTLGFDWNPGEERINSSVLLTRATGTSTGPSPQSISAPFSLVPNQTCVWSAQTPALRLLSHHFHWQFKPPDRSEN